MNFGEALQALKNGKRVKRAIWDGHWVYIFDAMVYDQQLDVPVGAFAKGGIILACLKDNQGLAPATPYQQDILSEDWQIVE